MDGNTIGQALEANGGAQRSAELRRPFGYQSLPFGYGLLSRFYLAE